MDIGKGKQPFRYINHSIKIILLGLIVLSILFTLNQFKLSNYFPIKSVRVYGLNRVDRHEVQTLIAPLVDRSFFSINVDAIRERLIHIPWVADIFVRRYWPDRVEITVVEKNAVAHWNGVSLLSQAGEIFIPKKETIPTNLPKLVGPNGKQVVMLQYFNKINRLLAPLHAKISYLELTPYYNWKLTLSNGIALQVGHKDILTRLDHFVRVYPKIVGNRAAEVDYVDLRYANGMAVRWKNVYTA